MTYVVTDNCQDCRFTDCVTVCPVDCFRADDKMVYIDPEECIDCGACLPECPVEAIFPEEDLPADKEEWTQINADKSASCALISTKEDPLPTAEEKKKKLGF